MKLSEAEWTLLEVLWQAERCTLGEITAAIGPISAKKPSAKLLTPLPFCRLFGRVFFGVLS